MALKDKWVDKVNGVDIASADDINQVAGAVIELENKVESGGVERVGSLYISITDYVNVKVNSEFRAYYRNI